ncbi:PstS family phosphate ABC transporter substrate-binding protein [Alistipes sp. ZOR0009]|uniref:PstS family phosphate ABC transporter substrate-binding protein n=1 Tax=Alistipes sp. ZOR0009 TaxID=1339253 RepID=UPI00064639A6|nr:PstS family phosphate ABC transporter substrate-binding protein [Alistipes sp. ZOR0009]
MKKSLFVLAGVLLISQVSFGQKISAKGSDTVLPLAQKEAELYMNTTKGTNVSVTGGGSGVGIAALMDGSTDIAMSSRALKMDEKMKFKSAGKDYTETLIGWDALAVIVNPSNKVAKLTRQQLEDIFTGKITNWKDVGGANLKIVVYSRESSSGTYEFFKEHVMSKKNFANNVLSMPATGAIIQSVSQTKGAIGYVGLAYLERKVKAVAVAFDDNKFVTPSFANAHNGTYPIVRPLYFFNLKQADAKVAPFIKFIKSGKGQAVVKEVGYIPIKK